MSENPKLEAETAVVGSILIDPRCLPAVRKIIGPEHFTVEWCWAVFCAACALADAGEAIDPVLIRYKSERMGYPLEQTTLIQAMDLTPTAANAELYAKALKEGEGAETLAKSARPRTAKSAAEFGEDNTRFLWYPYIPIGDYTVMMADGGTGKTLLCCGIIADISSGRRLPGEMFDRDKQNALIISGEDSGEILKKRLKSSGADLERVFILDRIGSEGMSLSQMYDEFEATILEYKPALVVLDPWHSFLGENVDISRVNALRPILQKIANLCKRCDCAMFLISHVNKRAQGENANNAATGSTDLINAARSAFRVIFDESDEDSRIMVHTKSNYAGYGKSVKYRIVNGGVVWNGFSEITRTTLEQAARRRSTPGEVMHDGERKEVTNKALIEALKKATNPFVATRYTYDEFKAEFGDLIFGGRQPKKALDAVRDKLADEGYFLRTGIDVRHGKVRGLGFSIQQANDAEPEQSIISEM